MANKIALSAFVFIFSAFISTSFAASLSNPGHFALEAAAAYAGCKANFTESYIGQLATDNIPNLTLTNVTSLVTTLVSDNFQLQAYASANNSGGFSAYVKSTFDPQLVSISKATVAAVKNAKISGATLVTLKSQYNATLATYKTCSTTALNNFKNGKAQYYQNRISALQREIAKENSKGLNTTAW